MSKTHLASPRAQIAVAFVTLAATLLPSATAIANGVSGIDISHHQGQVRWHRVSRAGVDFAFVKATEGFGVRDSLYVKNHHRAHKVDIKVGAYHFARPNGAQQNRVGKDARREAKWFLKVAKPQRSDLTPVLDLETAGPLNKQELVKWTGEWLNVVRKEVGAKPIVYASPSFWRDNFRGSQRFAHSSHPLWVAHYTNRRPEVPAAEWDGYGWTFWQFTDCGRVRGIRGCVDRNHFSGQSLGKLLVKPEVKRPSKKLGPPKKKHVKFGERRKHAYEKKRHHGQKRAKGDKRHDWKKQNAHDHRSKRKHRNPFSKSNKKKHRHPHSK